MSISWAGFYRMHLHDDPNRASSPPLRMGPAPVPRYPHLGCTDPPTSPTSELLLTALVPQILRRHQEQFSTVRPPHWVRESPSMQRCVALASLDSLPAEWSLAQWPITPSKALRGAHRTLAPMSSVAQLVLLTHGHSSGRLQQMEGKALQSEDPGSHMWPWLGWWWFRCLVEESRDPGVRTHRKAGQEEPRSLQSPGQAPAWETEVTWTDLELWMALGS